jgi:uncharacterized protein (DUF1015 family)
MANIFPFRAYRYTAAAQAPLSALVTQPYDKISPAMRERYLSLSPYNLVRIILGKPGEHDDETNNVYTRAAQHFADWIAEGVLAPDETAAFYPYFQEFVDPDTGETLTRKGFIALGEVSPYEAGIVHRHEKTLAGPKKDRLELLRHTHAHFGQIFMLYDDPTGEVDSLLDATAAQAPQLAEVRDDYTAMHRLWRITDQAQIERLQRLLAGKKLIIADGHHRYETALRFREESPLPGAACVMMTLVNLRSPGLKILPTHRVLRGLESFNPATLLMGLIPLGQVSLEAPQAFRRRLAQRIPGKIVLGVALPGQEKIHVLTANRPPGMLDVSFLHDQILSRILGISEEAIAEQHHLDYVRGAPAAMEAVDRGGAQAAFLLQPATVDEVAAISLSGGVMPQKSTDFYPKLLSGLTIYRLDG